MMNHTFHDIRRSLLAILLLIPTASCSLLTDRPAPPETLGEARALWEAHGYDTYRFRFGRGCYCAPRVLEAIVYVRADTVYAFTGLVGDGESLDPETFGITVEDFRSVEQLFYAVERSDPPPWHVEYHPHLGYPTEVFLGDVSSDTGVSYSAEAVMPLR